MKLEGTPCTPNEDTYGAIVAAGLVVTIAIGRGPTDLTLPIGRSIGLIRGVIVKTGRPDAVVSQVLVSGNDEGRTTATVVTPGTVHRTVALPDSALSLQLSKVSVVDPVVTVTRGTFTLTGNMVVIAVNYKVIVYEGVGADVDV